ncbi:MAG: prepilin-type N-terminal cleavage/methylation domain-containing protein [Nitrospirota bacterium]
MKGYSLLEVMIAVMILSIGLISMISLFGSGHQLLGKSRKATLTVQLAQEKMESLRRSRPVNQNKEEQIVESGMTRKWTIVRSQENPSVWVITVDVFPTNEPERTYSLKSLLYY